VNLEVIDQTIEVGIGKLGAPEVVLGGGAKRGRVERHRAVAAHFHAVDVKDAGIAAPGDDDVAPDAGGKRALTVDLLFCRPTGGGDGEADLAVRAVLR